ncbi:MAG: bifunctional demethylmenaquinone methyltransferase/2-methoxy-6-polyprenyl-1,4-benzoquinol methylase UbiE [Deltaproteobacteria bacterium]|nr:bifunctional demethylmenaquinone methyltransferase/2-methoxy-6-polyprenyl-1,4-benzoquinol methylase UbiE [Deltaproteobacteria bacterium]
MKKKELPFIKEMFDSLAPKYDLLNRLLSLRRDLYWRRAMVSEINLPQKGFVLDVACGTADVALEILRRKGKNFTVCGLDFSPGMLILAADKINKEQVNSNIHLLAGNALSLPFKAETFDAVTIAFGIRNIIDKKSALKAFYESLKKGGKLIILELTTPKKGPLLSLYLFYTQKILPLIGWFFSNNLKAYQYLPSSVIKFPQPDEFSAIMQSAGFSNVVWHRLTLGVATLYVGLKE